MVLFASSSSAVRRLAADATTSSSSSNFFHLARRHLSSTTPVSNFDKLGCIGLGCKFATTVSALNYFQFYLLTYTIISP